MTGFSPLSSGALSAVVVQSIATQATSGARSSIHLWARRKLIRDNGRPMTLSRVILGSDPPDYIQVSCMAFSPGLIATSDQRGRSEVATVGLQMYGDEVIEMLNDEILAASWPSPPRRNDRILWGGLTRTVQNAAPVYDGTLPIGWTLTVRS